MPCETKTETIDGLEVTTTQLPALRAFNLLSRLGRIIAPVLAGGQVDLDSDVSTLAPALGAAFAELDADGASKLAADVLVSTTVLFDGKLVSLDRPERIDAVFTGRLLTMLRVIAFALKVNFADFFEGAPAQIEALASAPKKENAST